MPEQRKKFSPEFRDEAIKMVIESSQPIAKIARELNIKEGTLGNWVNTYRREHAGEEPPLTISERARLRELEKEVRELRMKAEFLGKAAGGLLRPGISVTEKFEFIDGEKGNYPLVCMFNWMGVSKSGYYEWHGRPDSVTARRRAGLKELIQQVFDEFDETYGYRRIHAELNRRGVPCGPELIRALVRELGLVACQPRPWRLTTIPDADVATTPDLVKRNFTANEPGAKLVGDITYVKTWNGWLYLATVIDCYTKMVVGYAMATHMETSLIRAAIDMAARNISLPKDAIFHSDRGSQYTSSEYRKHLQELRIRPSLGRTGICYDNAMAESFNAALKTELVYRTAFPTHEHARKAIARYIEFFYNRKRLHSGLGYRIPIEVHDEYLNRQFAA